METLKEVHDCIQFVKNYNYLTSKCINCKHDKLPINLENRKQFLIKHRTEINLLKLDLDKLNVYYEYIEINKNALNEFRIRKKLIKALKNNR